MLGALRRVAGSIFLIASGLVPLYAAENRAVDPLPTRESAEGIHVYRAPHALADPANEGAVANLGFIMGRDAVAVIDTGGSLRAGRRLLAAVRARTALPIR